MRGTPQSTLLRGTAVTVVIAGCGTDAGNSTHLRIPTVHASFTAGDRFPAAVVSSQAEAFCRGVAWCGLAAETLQAASLRDKVCQRLQEAVYFVGGVVVDEADAEEAAGFFHVEMLGEIQSVIVSVPGEEAAVA